MGRARRRRNAPALRRVPPGLTLCVHVCNIKIRLEISRRPWHHKYRSRADRGRRDTYQDHAPPSRASRGIDSRAARASPRPAPGSPCPRRLPRRTPPAAAAAPPPARAPRPTPRPAPRPTPSFQRRPRFDPGRSIERRMALFSSRGFDVPHASLHGALAASERRVPIFGSICISCARPDRAQHS